MRIAATLLKAPVHLYRATIKPWTGMECRHLPTCSEYALEAIDKNGAWKGFWLMISRIARCNPWGSSGYDPAPDLNSVRHPFAPWRYGRWRGPASKETEAVPMTTVLKLIPSADGLRRVAILRHPHGLYGFEEEELRYDEDAEYWHPSGDECFSICDTPETAEREARDRIAWLKNADSEETP